MSAAGGFLNFGILRDFDFAPDGRPALAAVGFFIRYCVTMPSRGVRCRVRSVHRVTWWAGASLGERAREAPFPEVLTETVNWLNQYLKAAPAGR
jgi:hypothetical protein